MKRKSKMGLTLYVKQFANCTVMNHLTDLKQDLMAHRDDLKNNQRVAEKLYGIPYRINYQNRSTVAKKLREMFNDRIVDASFENETVAHHMKDSFTLNVTSKNAEQLPKLAKDGLNNVDPFVTENSWISVQKDGSLGAVTTQLLIAIIDHCLGVDPASILRERIDRQETVMHHHIMMKIEHRVSPRFKSHVSRDFYQRAVCYIFKCANSTLQTEYTREIKHHIAYAKIGDAKAWYQGKGNVPAKAKGKQQRKELKAICDNYYKPKKSPYFLPNCAFVTINDRDNHIMPIDEPSLSNLVFGKYLSDEML